MATERHRIARVDREVQQHLFDHAGVGAHVRRPRRVLELDDHILAKNPVEHSRQVANDDVHVDVPDLDRLTPAERQQLPRQRRRPFRALRNVGDGFTQIDRQSRIARDFFGSTENRRSGCC